LRVAVPQSTSITYIISLEKMVIGELIAVNSNLEMLYSIKIKMVNQHTWLL